MKIGFLITARMKSTRLPKKLTLKIYNREIISWMIDRIKLCPIFQDIVIATSTNIGDDILCKIADKEKIKYYRGSEEDVLERLYEASKIYHFDYILNITADSPLVAYDFMEKMVEEYKKTNADLITNFKLPHGLYLYGIKPDALKKVLDIKNDINTEVWGRYFTDTGLFKVVDMKIPKKFQRNNYRLSLDYSEDYKFFKALYQGMGKETYKKTTIEILEFLDKHPEIVKINQHCEKIGQQRIESQSRLILK